MAYVTKTIDGEVMLIMSFAEADALKRKLRSEQTQEEAALVDRLAQQLRNIIGGSDGSFQDRTRKKLLQRCKIVLEGLPATPAR